MKSLIRSLIFSSALAVCWTLAFPVQAQDMQDAPPMAPATEDSAPPAADNVERTSPERRRDRWERRWRDRSNNAVVSIGHDSELAAGERAEAVVSILGSASSAGEVSDAVVSIFGNSRATGPVGESVVAVLGDVYVNSRVGDQVVAVLGDVELGPEAEIDGDVVSVGGTVRRDPQAVVRGNVQNVAFFSRFGRFEWLRPWIENSLFYGRPLALAPGLGWAWTLALVMLGIYILLALMFRSGVEKCVHTLETQPGRSILAALLAMLLTPVLIVLLCITLIGIAAVPFVGLGILCLSLFGKAVMLAWLGGRLTKPLGVGVLNHPAFAVLVGGIIVLALYLVPVLGFIVYKLLAIMGFGVVVYTLILAGRNSRREHRLAAAPVGAYAATGAPESDVNSSFTAETHTAETGDAAAAAPPSPAASSSQLSAATQPRAGFWIRMGALLIDVLLVGVLVSFLDGGATLIVLAAYGAVMWKLKGTTIGGIVCNLKVVRVDDREIDWPTAIVRALGCFLSLAVVGLGFFWIAFDDERQAWHDKIAGTVVVRMPKGVSLV